MTDSEKLDALFADRIKRHCSHGDIEIAHSDADDLLIELVRHLGYTQTADAWSNVDKWYA
jgi:hypothetical protein